MILKHLVCDLSFDKIFVQIVKVLEFIGKKEGLQIPPEFAARVATKSNRSLRRAILLFEACRVKQLSTKILLVDCCYFVSLIQFVPCDLFPAPINYVYHGYRYPFTNNQVIPPMDWEEYVFEIASDIMKEQSPKRCFTLNTFELYSFGAVYM